MENEKLQIVMGEKEKAEIIIREVNEVNELKVLAPIQITLDGVIESPVEFLLKRLDQKDQINQKKCHVIVSKENLSIILITNEDDKYKIGQITGRLEEHPKFKEFGINSGKVWDPNLLGQFCKMNRAFFLSVPENMDLVTKLKSFEAKVSTAIDKEQKENGNFKDNYSGVVTSNLPGAFKLKLPLFKGRPAEEIEVEFFASVNGRNVGLQLFSPGAAQAIEEIRDQVIDAQIKEIREIAPDIAIIEQ
jgi:hypothetical protein